MKAEKKGVIAVSAVLIAAIIAAFLLIPVIGQNSVSRFYREDLKNVDNVRLISRCEKVGDSENSVAGFKESVRLGADGVIIDLCFRPDGTPVISGDYTRAETAQTVEELFKAMNEDRFNEAAVYLNIVQLSDISALNDLAVKYDVLDRLFLIGIDSEHYGLIDSDDTIIPLLLSYNFTDSELKSLKNGDFQAPDVIEKYGSSGLLINSNQLTSELCRTLNDYGIIFLADGIKKPAEMCKILTDSAENIVVSDIQKSKEILNTWTEKMKERYKASVEKSLKELSEKSADTNSNQE